MRKWAGPSVSFRHGIHVHTFARCLLATMLGSIPVGSALSMQLSDPVLIDAQEAELRNPEPQPEDFFGTSVAIDGDLAVIGSPWDDNEHGPDAGSVHVYERSGTSWTQRARLLAPGGAPLDSFGGSVAISGSTIVVGAHGDDTAIAPDAGSVYVFERCGMDWVVQAQLVHPAGSAGDRFGFAVSIDHDTIVVGAFLDDDCALDSGSAFVFGRVDAGDRDDRCDDPWTLEAWLSPSICQPESQFGQSVDVQRDRAVVGAHRENSPEYDRGAAYVFEKGPATWFETARLVAEDGGQDQWFGHEVALDGATVVVGAQEAEAAYVFVLDAGAWSFRAKLVDPDATTFDGTLGDRFGHAIDVQDGWVLIGAPFSDTPGPEAGCAHLFQRSGTAWSYDQRVTAHDLQGGHFFGASVALDSGTAFVASPGHDGSSSDAGSVAVFTLSRGRFERFGAGDGSGETCPCSNSSVPGMEQGCASSLGPNRGAKLSIAGSDSASSDDFRLIAWNTIPRRTAVLFAGPDRVNGGAGVPFGNGLRLVGRSIVRHGMQIAGPDSRAEWGPGLGASTGWTAGSTRHFQVWYHDPSHAGCPDVFNLTNGVSVAFRP